MLGTGGVTVVEGGRLLPSNAAGREVLTTLDARVQLLGAEDAYDLAARRLVG